MKQQTIDLADQLAAGVLSGNRLALTRAISQVEDQTEAAPILLGKLYPHSGRAHIIGVTGAPGAGKSTLVTALAQSYRAQGETVGIVAVDPTSPFTGGALLGDRVRMRVLSGDAGVFMRSMATRGSLGGLSLTTSDVIHVLDAAGFSRILVETVGVGQAEVEIASTAHTTLVIDAPGMGDEVQAIKAGILEIADLLVVNKADRPGADNTVRALQQMLELEGEGPRLVRHHGQLMKVRSPESTVSSQKSRVRSQESTANNQQSTVNSQPSARWEVMVLKTVASANEGVEELRGRIAAHWDWLQQSGEVSVREQLRAAKTVENILRAELNRRILAAIPQTGMSLLIEQVRTRQVDPYQAAKALLVAL